MKDLRKLDGNSNIPKGMCIIISCHSFCQTCWFFTLFFTLTRVEGHRQKASSICKHYYKEHNTAVPNNFLARFIVIKKCMNKFDCLVNEMLCIHELKPTLNVQSDSLRAKVFK